MTETGLPHSAAQHGSDLSLRNARLWLIGTAAFIFLLTLFSANKNVGSDSKLTLLVSQALIEQGTIKLDAYQADTLIDFHFRDYVDRTNLIIERNGHYYAYFPAGPSLLSVPIVWAYNLLGNDMRTTDNFDLQILLAALSTTLIYGALYQMGTFLVAKRASLIIAFFAVTGSTLASTLGTAWWTLNLSTLFITLVLLFLVRDLAGRPFNPYAIGILLFLCYFSRPSTAVFILPVLGYLFWIRRRLFWPAAAVSAILLAAYLIWSQQEFGQLLPAYSSLARLQVERAPAVVAVLGNLFSPSRGLFVFSPFLLLALAGLVIFWRELVRQPLLWLCIIWFFLQLVLVSRAASWWGGVSYGPRLLTDMMPGFVLLLYMLWQSAENGFSLVQQRVTMTAFLCLGLVSIVIHLNGLYRPAALRWNQVVIPGPTQLSVPLGDFFDWRYAQFMAGNEMVCKIAAEKVDAYLRYDESLAPYHIGMPITWAADSSVPLKIRNTLELAAQDATISALDVKEADSAFVVSEFVYMPIVGKSGNLAIFSGWEVPVEGGRRRLSVCPEAEIAVYLADETALEEMYWLRIAADSVGSQDVLIYLNDSLIGEVSWPAVPDDVAIAFPGHLLKPGMLNRIGFVFPDARSGTPEFDDLHLRYDDRQLALGLTEITISTSLEKQIAATPTPSPYP